MVNPLIELFPDHNSVFFLHTPKNAGTYIGNNFFNQEKFFYMNCGHLGWSEEGDPIERHNSDDVRVKFRDLQKDVKILKIGSIRNPFDILPSIYYHNNTSGFNNFNDSNDVKSFGDFIDCVCGQTNLFMHGFSRAHAPIGPYDTPPRPLSPMGFLYEGILNENLECVADVLIRVEKIEEGLNQVFEFLKTKRKSAEKLKRNKSRTRPPKDYRELYTNDMRIKVERRFKRELKVLGYDFFGPLDSRALIIPKQEKIFLNPKRSSVIFYSWNLSNKFHAPEYCETSR